MSTRAKVAVLRTQPETVLQDYERLAELAGMKASLDPGATTIIKDNISWHFPFPSANTTPWQLEGAILALRHAGFQDLVAVQNKTVYASRHPQKRSIVSQCTGCPAIAFSAAAMICPAVLRGPGNSSSGSVQTERADRAWHWTLLGACQVRRH